MFSFSIMKTSFCFTDIKIIAIPATGFVNDFRFLRTIQLVLTLGARGDSRMRDRVSYISSILFREIRLWERPQLL